MLLIQQIKLQVEKQESELVALCAKKIGAQPQDILSLTIVRKSLDARKEPFYVYNVAIKIHHEKRYLSKKDVSFFIPYHYNYQHLVHPLNCIVVGFGPSGMLAAYLLAKAGANVTIFERGSMVKKRSIDVAAFWKDGLLNPESNVQFGEGGAGTFSDGKLTTRIKDDRINEILSILIEMGANPSIRYEAHPHIGSDVLKNIVKNFREAIIQYGGHFHFDTRVDRLLIDQDKVIGVLANNMNYHSDVTILAIGHSAQDTLLALDNDHITMEAKDFAVGVRVEHPQSLINQNQNKHYHSLLKASEYRLTYHTSNHLGVYSFCMCPGGYVVGSSSQPLTICTNGMSLSKRDNDLANSAILVQVKREAINQKLLFDGLNYQKRLEEKAYQLTQSYHAPSSNISDFMKHTISPLHFESSFKPGTKVCDLHLLFDSFIIKALKEAFIDFDKKIPGFIEHGIMIAPETRSSSMVRITRRDNYMSLSHHFLYPIGEGAGYAGGIMSSALDGFKVAEAIIKQFTQNS